MGITNAHVPLKTTNRSMEIRSIVTSKRGSMATKDSNAALQMDKLATPLIRYLTKRVHNNEDASDLAQEAFLRMHKFQQNHSLDNARAFLYKTANNLVVDQIRRNRVHEKYVSFEMLPDQSDEDNGKSVPSAERFAAAEQELARTYEVIDGMPPKVRRAFLLHRGKDLSYSEIAREMGVSNSMVEKYIVEALKILRKKLR